MLKFFATLLLSLIVGQEFQGQVKEVFTNVDTSTGYPLVGLDPPAIFLPLFNGGPNFVTDGSLVTPANPGMLLYGLQEFYFDKGEQLHFQITLRYASQGLFNGPSADPSSGGLWFGPWWNNAVASWLITDLAEYALIQMNGVTWCIPLGKRTPEETATYTVIVDRSSLKVGFNKNQVNMLVAPGKCGIDKKFSSTQLGKSEERCEPILADSNFEGPARLLLLMGNFFNYQVGYPTPSPFCQGTVFDQCHDNISRASRCRCEHPLTEVVPVDVIYMAQIDSVKIFNMEETSRCRGESSSSSYVPWFQRPVQLEQEAQSEAI